MAPYAMTKHAVVGLSKSLRFEGETVGVRVSVLCPSAIETSILGKANPADLSQPWFPDLRRYLVGLTNRHGTYGPQRGLRGQG